MSFSRALLLVVILDIVAGCVVFWPFCEHRDAMVDIYLMASSFACNLLLGAILCIISKTRVLGKALLCNAFIAAPLTLELSKLSYTLWNEKVFGDDISYFFRYGDHRYQLDLHGDKYMRHMAEWLRKANVPEENLSDGLQFCIFSRGENCNTGVVFGEHQKISDGYYVMTVDSNCHYISCDSIPLKGDTLILCNDSLYGLFDVPVLICTE